MGINAGKLNQMIRVMELSEGEAAFSWTERRKAWAKAEYTGQTNLFSSAGLGARTVIFTIRRQSIDLSCAIEWQGRHCFITAIDPTDDKLHYTVTAALPVTATASCKRTGKSFPVCLTEKYMGYERGNAMSEITARYVLVVPKAVVLSAGDLVTVGSYGVYNVQVPHELDPYKNEYEAERKGDA
jgi:head-tail adaptor